MPEAEIEEKFTLFPAISEDFKVLVLHSVAQEIFRREILDELKMENTELLGNEFDILRRIDNNFKEIEERIIYQLAKGIDLFDIEMY